MPKHVSQDEYVSRLEQDLKTKSDENVQLRTLLSEVLKSNNAHACDYCKNHICCDGMSCDCYEEITGVFEGETKIRKFDCMDLNFGTCRKLEKTPCNGCIENNFSGFELKI